MTITKIILDLIMINLIIYYLRKFIMNFCLFFSIYKEHPVKTENELEIIQKRRGQVEYGIVEKL